MDHVSCLRPSSVPRGPRRYYLSFSPSPSRSSNSKRVNENPLQSFPHHPTPKFSPPPLSRAVFESLSLGYNLISFTWSISNNNNYSIRRIGTLYGTTLSSLNLTFTDGLLNYNAVLFNKVNSDSWNQKTTWNVRSCSIHLDPKQQPTNQNSLLHFTKFTFHGWPKVPKFHRYLHNKLVLKFMSNCWKLYKKIWTKIVQKVFKSTICNNCAFNQD